MCNDILERLRVDPGQRTIGQLLQEREAAALEIERLRAEISRPRAKPRTDGREHATRNAPPRTVDHHREPAFRTGSMIRLAEVCRFLGLSRSTIYKKLSEGSFPMPLRLGDRAIRWRIDEIEAWRDARPTPRA